MPHIRGIHTPYKHLFLILISDTVILLFILLYYLLII
nr:MAG TPA: hypothetical protein [Bacteriophage sp.]